MMPVWPGCEFLAVAFLQVDHRRLGRAFRGRHAGLGRGVRGVGRWDDCTYLDQERECFVRRDELTATRLAVRLVGRNVEADRRTGLHPHETLVPARDHLSLAEHDRDRLEPVVAVVELDTVTRTDADVVDDDRVAGLRLGTRSLLDHRDLQLGRDLVGRSRPRACRGWSAASAWIRRPASIRPSPRCRSPRWRHRPRSRAVAVGATIAAARSEQQGGGDHQYGEGPAHRSDATSAERNPHVNPVNTYPTPKNRGIWTLSDRIASFFGDGGGWGGGGWPARRPRRGRVRWRGRRPRTARVRTRYAGSCRERPVRRGGRTGRD